MKTPAPQPVLTAEGEQAWLRFRRHLDWAEGFALVFLFSSDHRLVDTFRRRLADSLIFRTARMHRFVAETPDELVVRVMTAVRGQDAVLPPGTVVWWIELLRQDAPGWSEGYRTLLVRLNEHREMLRCNTGRPVVLVLPGGTGPLVRQLAPDLWSIRDFSIDIDELDTVREIPIDSGREEPVLKNYPADLCVSPEDTPLPEQVLEWRRLQAHGAAGREALRAGWAATEAAKDTGMFALAAEIARDVLGLARAGTDGENKNNAATRMRDLSISLENVGKTASDLGRSEEAQQAYAESLALRRRLHEQLGDTPQVLRDLSISLDNVGKTASDLGRSEEAQQAYAESLALMRRLHEQLGDTPQVLRDLSISLNNVGKTASDLGRSEEAQQAYAESLALMRRLHEQLGDTPQVLRDLSISLDNVGKTASDLGRSEEAQQAYAESLALRRRLHEQLGDTPQVLRDLSISLNNVGKTASDLGRSEEAQQAYAESLALMRRLHEQLGDTPQVLWDLAVSGWKMGEVFEIQGKLLDAVAEFRKVRAIASRLASIFPQNPKYTDAVTVAEERLQRFEKK